MRSALAFVVGLATTVNALSVEVAGSDGPVSYLTSRLNTRAATIPQSSNGYTYKGCFMSGINAIAWDLSSQQFGQTNSVDFCTNYCQTHSYTVAGVADEFCLCSHTTVIPPNPNDDSNCTITCPGNSAQICGGGPINNDGGFWSYMIYENRPQGTIPQSIQGFNYVGCFTNPDTAANWEQRLFSVDMIPDTCVNVCRSLGFSLAGVFGTSCFCAVNEFPWGNPNDDFNCNTKCPGDPTLFCGGAAAGAYQVYKLPVTPQIVQSTNGYNYAGCFVQGGVLLPWTNTFVDQLGNSVDKCTQKCANVNTQVAGVWDAFCLCTNATAPPNPNNDANCTSACPGDASEICGWSPLNGFSSYSLYNFATPRALNGYTLRGCFPVGLGNDVGFTALALSNSTTPLGCVNGCAAQGFIVAGLTKGNQCGCANFTIPVSEIGGPETCKAKCTGDSTEFCGGVAIGGAFDLYAKPVTPSVLQTHGDWHSLGCFSDNANARALHAFVSSGTKNVNVTGCLDTCQARGFTLAGVEFGHQCFCGNALLYGSSKIFDSTCTMPCAGQSDQFCGGPGALNLYQNGQTPFTTGTPALVQSHGNWTFVGCEKEAQQGRAIPQQQNIPTEQMSVERCLDACAAASFTVGALQNGQECWCGNVTLPAGDVAPDTDCNLSCTNDAREFCGAGLRNQVYSLSGAPSA